MTQGIKDGLLIHHNVSHAHLDCNKCVIKTINCNLCNQKY